MYDMDACRTPTGVTRHALAQLEHLAPRRDIELQVVSGRICEPDGLSYWASLGALARREFPLRTRDLLRFWRICPWPPLEQWTGPLDWVYCPAEYFVSAARARRAVTSHDILQDLRYGTARRRALLRHVFGHADLILSVSNFNTERLVEAFPECRGRVCYVPNGAEDLFFEAASESERAAVRADLGLPPAMRYLLSVANFQARKNLPRLILAAGRLAEVAAGDLALVLLGTGSEHELQTMRAAISALDKKARVLLPGYRQGIALRAIYAEATALVFPSRCESFGIPVVEAMSQGCPVALANSTALPEIGGDAGWYFNPEDEEAIRDTLFQLLNGAAERARRIGLGRSIADGFRWNGSNDQLVAALADAAGST
jgi:alpha-1,3-rhamnosyl/mannosyltransferase